jgi:hypothetical protein
MQNRFVVSGNIQDNKEAILAYELVEAEFKINLYVIDKLALGKENLAFLKDNWVKGETFTFGEETTLINPDINEDSILPAHIKSEQVGEIRHFQNEWAVQLLTNKLWEVYLNKLSDLKKLSEKLTHYSKDLFEETKGFWEQVLENKRERNISQQRLDEIKADVNEIFEKLKTFRKEESEEFEKASRTALESATQQLDALKKKIGENANFKTLADEVKQIQYNLRSTRFSKSHETAIRKAFDDTFHLINETRKSYFGNRNESRIAGLQEVLKKMEGGLNRDQSDLEYFTKKAESPKILSLELQLLKVRIRQIKERIDSKQLKVDDIKKTLEGLMKKANGNDNNENTSPSDEVEA